MSESPKQIPMFEATTSWFHVFKSMIDSGDLAKLPGSAVKCYLVIKSLSNFSTGKSFPALETISEKAGLSLSQVQRELKTLENFGYVSKSKSGRKNIYVLREKIEINDDNGQATALASWDYAPLTVKAAVADLKNVLLSGELAGAKIVTIERLQVNVNNISDHGFNVNIQQFMADLEKLPVALRDKVVAAWEASRTNKAGDPE